MAAVSVPRPGTPRTLSHFAPHTTCNALLQMPANSAFCLSTLSPSCTIGLLASTPEHVCTPAYYKICQLAPTNSRLSSMPNALPDIVTPQRHF